MLNYQLNIDAKKGQVTACPFNYNYPNITRLSDEQILQTE